jgi:hypothetical protein
MPISWPLNRTRGDVARTRRSSSVSGAGRTMSACCERDDPRLFSDMLLGMSVELGASVAVRRTRMDNVRLGIRELPGSTIDLEDPEIW